MSGPARWKGRAGAFTSAALLGSIGACAAGGGDTQSMSVRDSAGVRIVEHASLSEGTSAPVWRVVGPTARYGEREGEAALHDVRGVARLTDGRIAVANGGSAEILLLNATTTVVVGSGGAGPGSFMVLDHVAPWSTDSVVAFDPRLRRISIFHTDGAVGRTGSIDPGVTAGRGPLQAIGWLDGGILVLKTSGLDGYRIDRPDGLRVTRDNGTIVFVHSDGSVLDSISGLRGDDRAFSVTSPEDGRLRIRSQPVPFLASLEAYASGGGLVVGSTDAFEISVFDARAQLTMIVRVATPLRLVDEAVRAEWIAEQLAGLRESPQIEERRRALSELPLPDTLPAFGAVVLDAVGNLWVEEFSVTMPPDGVAWTVFSDRGAVIGRVFTPPNFVPHEIGANYILGLHEDELGVQFVHEYALDKPAG